MKFKKDLFGNAVIIDYCKNCGKERGKHNAVTKACPLPGKSSFKQFYINQFFELKIKKVKNE